MTVKDSNKHHVALDRRIHKIELLENELKKYVNNITKAICSSYGIPRKYLTRKFNVDEKCLSRKLHRNNSVFLKKYQFIDIKKANI